MAAPDQHPANQPEQTTDRALDPELGYTLQEMILATPDVEVFLSDLAVLAATEISTPVNAVLCGVTVIRRKKGVVAASSDERASVLDHLQNSYGDGPCLTALRDKTLIHVPDTAADTRWRDYLDAAVAEGVGSVLAVPLDLAGEADAVMNLYSVSSHGFAPPDITMAETFTEHTAKSLRLALKMAQLRHARDDLYAAMQSRAVIDMAVGIIMAQNRCRKDAAFKVLTDTSSHRNTKLRDVAAQIVARVSGENHVTAYFDE
ncbi:ANTAR domain-containing protein [Paenarthrobacter sp. NPDC089989]|uniref:ANTAR domain-containing protein n=1 Tax=unclassified Paenarthrobacter TaxID=2634190 RepID=UPI003822BB79